MLCFLPSLPQSRNGLGFILSGYGCVRLLILLAKQGDCGLSLMIIRLDFFTSIKEASHSRWHLHCYEKD